MKIFLLVVGVGLLLQGVLVFGNLGQWHRKALNTALRRMAALAYGLLGGSFIVSAFWRPFIFFALVSLLFLAVVQQKIIRRRKSMLSKGDPPSGYVN